VAFNDQGQIVATINGLLVAPEPSFFMPLSVAIAALIGWRRRAA